MQKTFGEHRIRVEFNPDKNGLVDLIKQHSAKLIDLVETIPCGTDYDRESGRLKALALTAIEEAAMWAVKAATCEKIVKPEAQGTEQTGN